MAEEKTVSVSNSEAIFNSMATQQFNHDILALVKSSHPLIYVTTHEENRFKAYMHHLSTATKRSCYIWDVYKGLVNILNTKEKIEVAGEDDKDPDAILDIIITRIEKFAKECEEDNRGCIYILFGFDRFISPACDPETERRLKHIASVANRITVIIVGPSYVSTPSLDKDMALLDFPYPNDEEIKNTLYHVLESAQSAFPNASKKVKSNEDNLVKACRGLTLAEAQSAYCKSVVMAKKTKKNEFDIPTILNEKKQIIKKNPILDYVDTEINLDHVGGLDKFIDWLKKRKLAFRPDALEYGLPYPKGVLLVGVPGGGKSLSAKAAASYYEMPLLRLDFGKMFNSLVGESERSAREAIKMAESLAPCVDGDSEINASDGKTYKIKELLNDDNLLQNLHIYAFNEKTFKIERTKVKAIIKHSEQKEMILIKTFVGSINVTLDHKMLVNRCGSFVWVSASDIRSGDYILMPKEMRRDIIPFCINDSEKELFKNEQLDKNSNQLESDYMYKLYYLLGMIKSSGSINTKNGVIIYDTFDWSMMYKFSSVFSEIFGIEPDISSNQCVIYNSKISYLLDRSYRKLINQHDEYLIAYISGFIDSVGIFTNDESEIYLKCIINEEQCLKEFVKICHCLGVIIPNQKIPNQKTNNELCIKGISNLKDLCLMLDLCRKDLIDFISMALESNDREDCNFHTGMRIQKDYVSMFNSDKKHSNISIGNSVKINKNDITINKYTLNCVCNDIENQNITVPYELQKILESDVIGARVYSVSSSGMRDTYDLACEDNHNFFANNLLCHNCILWCDEIEKGLSGTASSGSTDGGTTSRVVSTFLTWQQEKTSPVFVFCTANNPTLIPPEFMRAGRFDEVFFVDLPSHKGREQIFEIQISRKGRDPKKFNIPKLASLAENYSGAEIEKAIEIAMFDAFYDNKREINTQDICNAIKSFKPLSETRKEEIEAMREWSSSRCICANTPDVDISTENIVKNNGVSNKSVDVDF